MNDLLAVTEVNGFAELVNVIFDPVYLSGTYRDAVRLLFKDLKKVPVDVLEDQVQFALSSEGFFELDDVLVFEHS